MGRLVHFEIDAEDMERAKKFYGDVFGWTFEDWSEYAGMPYFGATRGDASQPGIDGALIKRPGAAPEPGQADDSTEALILQYGGKLAMPKYALPGMAWQGYYHDTEGNLFGIHQPDVDAK